MVYLSASAGLREERTRDQNCKYSERMQTMRGVRRQSRLDLRPSMLVYEQHVMGVLIMDTPELIVALGDWTCIRIKDTELQHIRLFCVVVCLERRNLLLN
jgi:hypothetical protein